MLSAEQIHRFFEALAHATPAPRIELDYTSPFTLLVAVALSAQATDVQVNKVTPALFAVADTPKALVDLGEERVADYIRSIGLFRTKAKNLIRLSRRILDEHNGQVPCDREALEALAGIGRKSANVVLNVAFGRPVIAVDRHIFRVANRCGLASGKTPLAIERALDKKVPQPWKQNAHHWLVLHGRYVCKAIKPACPECVVREICLYPNKARS